MSFFSFFSIKDSYKVLSSHATTACCLLDAHLGRLSLLYLIDSSLRYQLGGALE